MYIIQLNYHPLSLGCI